MKIQLSKPQTDRRCRHASRLMVAIGVLAFAIITGSDVSAQSTSFGNFVERAGNQANADSAQVAQAGQFINDGKAYKVMNASQVPTAADRPGSIGAAINGVAQVGCQSCGTNCGGACGGYSTYGDSFYGGSYGGNACNTCYTGNACGIPCDPYCYALVEGLYMEREDENRGLSRHFGFNDYDHEWASRVTIGSLPNCVNGYELTYVSPLEWNASQSFASAGDDLGTVYGPRTTIPRTQFLALLPAFEDMSSQNQSINAEYWSIEGNRTLVGWDVAKILIGGRYISYDENFNFTGLNTAGANPLTAVAQSRTENHLVGAQIGLDLLYPVGLFAYSDFRARAGVYYNNAESQVTFVNDGTTIINVADDTGDIAGVFEIGSGIRYQLGEMLSVRAGTEMWYITEVAGAVDQARGVSLNVLDLVYRSKTTTGDDFFVFGFNLGAELRY